MTKLSDNALEVLNKRYFLKDFKGEPIEDWDGLCSRVAEHVASAESKEDEREWTVAFHSVMYNLDFLPNSPTLRNAGANKGNLSACFVLPIDDSRKSIFKTLQDAVEVQAFGGGTGYDFSNLRPEGSLISTTKGKSCGPLGFMRVFDFVIGEVIQQGGVRHGAQMGILRIDHPDIEKFIDCKKEEGKLSHFNISVAITDGFMDWVVSEPQKNQSDTFNFKLIFNNKTVGYVDGQKLWNKIIENAWANGEPGIVFIDRINQLNPLKDYETIYATNPCGEQPLAPYSSCNLGSINLSNFLKPHPRDGDYLIIDWDRLKEVVRTAVRFLDNVIDVNNYPIPEIEKETKKFRKVGLGVMGWADMLIKLKISYNSQEALDLAEKVMKFINETAWDYSAELGKEKGGLDFVNREDVPLLLKMKPKLIVRRNGTLTTIAPTGTLSLIAGCSAGIEPVFSFKYKKKCLDGEIEVLHPLWEEFEYGFTDACIEYPIPKYFVESKDVPIEQHVKMQAAFQKYTDNAVSKTINAPFETTKEDVDRAFRLAYELGCKGITFYRQGSREIEAQKVVLGQQNSGSIWIFCHSCNGYHKAGKCREGYAIPKEMERPVFADNLKPTPDYLEGSRDRIPTGDGTLWVHLFEDPDTGYKEVWSQISKEGRTISSMNAAIGRLATLALNKGASWADIEKQLRGIIGEKTAWFNGEQVLSPPDGIAKVIRKRKLSQTDWKKVDEKEPDLSDIPELDEKFFSDAKLRLPSERVINMAKLCPDCGSVLQFSEGCNSGLCTVCGWSSCS